MPAGWTSTCYRWGCQNLSKFNSWRGSHMTDAWNVSAWTLVGPRRFFSGSVCRLSPILAPSWVRPTRLKELWMCQTFGVCRTRMPVRICTNRPCRLHFAEARARKKRSSQNRLAVSSFFQNFWPVDLRSPTDLSDVPTDLGLNALFAWCARPGGQSMKGTVGHWLDSRHARAWTFRMACTLQCLQRETRNTLGERTDSPARLNELWRTSKTFGSLKLTTLFCKFTSSTLVSTCVAVFIPKRSHYLNLLKEARHTGIFHWGTAKDTSIVKLMAADNLNVSVSEFLPLA